MLTKIKYVLFAAALIWGSPAKAQSFLESLLDGVAKGLSSAAEQVLQQQRQNSQQTNTSVRTTDNIPPNSMVCVICKGTKKCNSLFHTSRKTTYFLICNITKVNYIEKLFYLLINTFSNCISIFI